MTQDDLTQALETGKAKVEQPEALDSSTPKGDTSTQSVSSTQTPSVEQYLPLFISLQSVQKWLAAAPTFVPQTFQEQIQFVSDGTTNSLYFWSNNQWNRVISSSSSSYFQQVFTAHRPVTKGNALIVGTGKTGYLTVTQALFGNGESFDGSTRNFIGQTFITSARTTAVRTITLRITSNVAAPITWTLTVYATTGGVPTGGALGSATVVTTTNATTFTDFIFSTQVPVSPSTQYAVVLTTNSPGNCATYSQTTTLTSCSLLSSSTGTTYTTDGTRTLNMKVYEVMTAAGQIQQADLTQTPYAADVNDLALNFVGFALSDAIVGASVNVNLGPVDADQSGLVTGTEYYLSNTPGALSATAGTISVKVGLALSATQLLIKLDNYP